MHAVTAATVAAGGGRARGRAAGEDGARRGARDARVQRARHRRALLLPGAGSRRGRTARSRISGRKSFVTSGGHADVVARAASERRGRGPRLLAVDGDAAGVALRRRLGGPRDGGQLERRAGPRGRRRSTPTRGSARAGAAADLVFGVVAPYVPRRPRGGQRRHRARRRRSAATEHAAGRRYPDGTSLAEMQTIQHLLADMDLASRHARGWSSARRRALGEAGDEPRSSRSWRRRSAATDAAARDPAGARGAAGRATRPRCRSSATCATRARVR